MYGMNQDSGRDASDESKDDLLFVLPANTFLDQLPTGEFWEPWHHQYWAAIPWPVSLPFWVSFLHYGE